MLWLRNPLRCAANADVTMSDGTDTRGVEPSRAETNPLRAPAAVRPKIFSSVMAFAPDMILKPSSTVSAVSFTLFNSALRLPNTPGPKPRSALPDG